MGKFYDLSKLIRELAKQIPKDKAIKASEMKESSLCCEECGAESDSLKAVKSGFFYCEPCHFMFVRRQAVQGFDNA